MKRSWLASGSQNGSRPFCDCSAACQTVPPPADSQDCGVRISGSMKNGFYQQTLGPGSPPDPNIYDRTLFYGMCISVFLGSHINWNLLGYSVGRGHDPADQVPVFDRGAFNGIGRKKLRFGGGQPAPYGLNEPFSVQQTDRKLAAGRRGHDPALRNTPSNSNLSLYRAKPIRTL